MVALHFITHVPKSSQDGKVEKTLFLLFLFKKKSVPMQMNSALILLFTIVSSFGFLMESEYRNEFVQFMREHNKVYQNFEFQHRYQIFKSNLDYIHSFNANNSKIKLRMNHFGDFTSEEFASYNGFTTQAKSMKHGNTFKSNKRELPDSFDWRAKGAVTPIKNQGSCGSCWSFSTTGSTEGCHAIKTGELVGLSEQQLLDCSVSYGNEGCEGGVMTDAMQYIIETGGLETETSYPYAAKDDTCRFNVSDVVATLSSYSNIPQGDEDTLQQAVSVGPVSVAIDASHRSFQFYSSGVYYEPKCSSTSLDHGVLVVGWGADESGDLYWIVKNSWGVSWGLSGYIWMSRNHNNNCGIATMATLPNC